MLSGHLAHPKYRADIDGLRAVAVLAVIGFHAFPSRVPGGFVGVDIFFVVSGYLISSIIIGSLERESFSFLAFYSRRIRRIFPALLLMLIGIYSAGWFVLLADEYKQLGKHMAGGAGFVSNLVLWNETGYFDNAAGTKPLLHLWSLGIEEQFYIVWPFLLWAAWKRRFNLLAITIAVASISFALNMIEVSGDPGAAFYLPQTRFWELLIGSALAYVTLHKHAGIAGSQQETDGKRGPTDALQLEVKGTALRNVQSLLGAMLIGASLLLITRDKAFPGWWAALPTVGAALIVSAGAQAWLNRAILSSRAMVWCGLISYPLYLWHWPLLSLPRIINGEAPSREVRISAILISIVLAWATYGLVERPIRLGTYNKTLTTGLLVLMLLVGWAGYFSYKRNGLTSRAATKPEIRNEGGTDHLTFYQNAAKRFYPCTPLSLRKQAVWLGETLRCLQSKEDRPIDIAIIGDSHAEHLFLGLAEELRNRNISYYIGTTLPILSDREFDNIYRYVLDDRNIRTIIIAAVWHVKQWNVPKGSNLETELSATAARLIAANKTVYITDDVPSFSFDPKVCKYSRPFSNKNNCVQDRVVFDQYHDFYPRLQSVEHLQPGVKLLNTAEYFCDSRFCSMARDGKLLYRDNNHLNLNGSRYVAKRILEDNPQLAKLN